MRADRGQVGSDAGLVVGGAAAEQPTVALGRLERLGLPVGAVARRAGRRGGRRAAPSARRPAPACGRSPTAGRPAPRPVGRRSPRPRTGRPSPSAERRTSSKRAGSALTDGIRTSVFEVAADRGQDAATPRGAGRQASCRRPYRRQVSGSCGVRSDRSPDARTRPAATASANVSRPAGQRQPGVGVGLDDGRRRAAGVPGALDALDRGDRAAPAPRRSCPGCRSVSTARKCFTAARRSSGVRRLVAARRGLRRSGSSARWSSAAGSGRSRAGMVGP